MAALVGLIGVINALEPSASSDSWKLAAQVLVVLSATGAIVVTRKLLAASTVGVMTFYIAGLTLIVAPFAFPSWQIIPTRQWPALMAIGVFAKSAQLCFPGAHQYGQAGFLAALSCASLVLSTTAGYFVFDELPESGFWVGGLLIMTATLWIKLRRQSNPRRNQYLDRENRPFSGDPSNTR